MGTYPSRDFPVTRSPEVPFLPHRNKDGKLLTENKALWKVGFCGPILSFTTEDTVKIGSIHFAQTLVS